jgi:hypothetical protein
MRAITATATVAAPQSIVNLDLWDGAAIGIQIYPTGGAAYTLDYSFDDPNDLINPIPLASMFWDTSMVPGRAIDSTSGYTFSMPVTPLWGRIRLLNGVGAVRATFLQLGVHSRSNIPTEMDVLTGGPNFAGIL